MNEIKPLQNEVKNGPTESPYKSNGPKISPKENSVLKNLVRKEEKMII